MVTRAHGSAGHQDKPVILGLSKDEPEVAPGYKLTDKIIYMHHLPFLNPELFIGIIIAA